MVGRLTRDACRFARYAGLDTLKGFALPGTAPHAVTALYFYGITGEFGKPDVVVDISEVVKDWERAMQFHASQMQTRAYVDLRISAARNLGLSIGVEYAAGLFANDPVRVAALSDLALSSRWF